MSTGGAAINAMMNTEVAVNKVGIMITPNQPMYKRFSVEVIHSQKRAQRLALSRRSKIAVIVYVKKIIRFSPYYIYLYENLKKYNFSFYFIGMFSFLIERI
jgi:hypothetical protein